MNLHRVILIPLFFSLTSLAPAQAKVEPKPLSPFQQTLLDAEKGFIAAARKGDMEYFKRTLADDYSWVGMDGQLYDRQDALGELGYGGVDLTAYNMKALELSDSAGIVTYDLIMKVPAVEDQGPPPRYQHWSTTWIKQGDQWKIKFQQTTPTHWGDW